MTLALSRDARVAPPKRLLVAIHDVGPAFESEIDRLRDFLARHVPTEKLALLVAPDQWDEAPLVPGSPFAGRLRAWGASGAEILVHGWFHRDTIEHRGRSGHSKTSRPTENDGDSLAMDPAASRQRMADGKRLIEDIIGRSVADFIATDCSYGPEAQAALGESDFTLAEDDWNVWRPASGEILCQGPVITWGGSGGPRIASPLAASQIRPSELHDAPVVRLAIHPGDSAMPLLLTSIDRVLDRLCRRRSLARYADLSPFDGDRAGLIPLPTRTTAKPTRQRVG